MGCLLILILAPLAFLAVLFFAAGEEGSGLGGLCLALAGLVVWWFCRKQARWEEEQQRAEERRRAEEERLKAILSNLMALRALPPRDFERAVMLGLGGEVTQGSADRGIDGWVRGIPVQIKQSDRVGRPVVDSFETAVRRAGKSRGYIVAFSFTKGAEKEAQRAVRDGLEINLLAVEQVVSSSIVPREVQPELAEDGSKKGEDKEARKEIRPLRW